MAAGMAIVGGIQAIGAYKNYKDNKKAAKNQQATDYKNIENMRMENEETVRRTEEAMMLKEQSAVTTSAASGFKGGAGTVKSNYLEGLKGVHKQDLDWLKKANASNISIKQSETSNRYSANRAQGKSQLISGLTGALGSGLKSGMRLNDNQGWWS